MCMTCGCKDLDNDHGDAKNLTLRRLIDAAEAGGVTLEEAVDNVAQGVRSAKMKVSRDHLIARAS